MDGLPVELRPQALGVGPGRLSLEAPVIGGILREQWASVAKDYAAIAAADPRVERIERWEVEVVALDSLRLSDVTAMKLDAEGAEEEVLRGAEARMEKAVAGVVGGGGIGDLAIRYGYYRFQTDVMLAMVTLLVVLVQLIQWVGLRLAKALDKR